MDAQSEVLIASADSETRRTLADILSHWGLEPNFCSTVSKAKATLARQAVPPNFLRGPLGRW
jgi:DNA-binding NtrC family response regulator